MTIKTLRNIEEIRSCVNRWRSKGARTALVPTMGGLHEGHLSLVRHARGVADHVVVSLFVNPTQFNNKADLEKYPRNEESDRSKLADLDVDVLFAPDAEEMYPKGFTTEVTVAGASDILCGKHRPGHFDGVATIVTKLFLQTGADVACFGEKDFQQLSLVRRLVQDLNIPIEIAGVPTVREKDGLAMSSRNVRLSATARKTAPKLNATLVKARNAILEGQKISVVCKTAIASLEEAGFSKVDYLELRAEDDLDELKTLDRPARLLAAAWIGDVRLIDNIIANKVPD